MPKEEEFLLLRRRHWVSFFLEILPFLIGFFLIFFIFLFILFTFSSWPPSLLKLFPSLASISFKFFLLFLLSLIVAFFLFGFFLSFLRYYFTCWIVTTKRVICFEFLSLLNIKSSSIPLDKIQDLVVTLKGAPQIIFNFGDLQIETAGEFGKFVMREISEPEIVKKVILEAQGDLKK